MTLETGRLAVPPEHADGHSTVYPLAVRTHRTRVVIEFAGDKPSLRRIQIIDGGLPSHRRGRRHRSRPARRLPTSWPEVAGVVVGDWSTTLRTSILAIAVGLTLGTPPSGLGAASTAMTGAMLFLATRKSQVDATKPVPHQLPS